MTQAHSLSLELNLYEFLLELLLFFNNKVLNLKYETIYLVLS